MTVDTTIKEIKPKMEATMDSLKREFKAINTGRASSALVEDIKVNQYNSLMSLKEIATISTPSATLIVITPWDKDSLQAIETAIHESNLNINPQNDGSAIRLPLPPMSQERREELARLAKQKAESARISIRTVREDGWRRIQREEKAGELTEDDLYVGEKELQNLVSNYNKLIDETFEGKEQEIMKV